MRLQWFRRQGRGLTASLILLACLGFVLLRPHTIPDWIKLYGYTPPAEIASLADNTTMTSAARHLFYLNHSAVLEKTAFREHCPHYDEHTIVIGCYHSGQSGIYVLSVDDERLAGVEQVTAAHEMLHAAYERLSSGEKKRVNALLRDYQQNNLKDQRILSAIESYKKTEPGQELNEMHSMFGTEIAELPDELEAYYSQYFTTRKSVVAFANKYQDAFTSREAALANFDAQLSDQEIQIQANTRKLDEQSADIERERSRLDRLRNQDIDAYNEGVDSFNALVNSYNALLDTTKALIERFNVLVEQRNAIAAQTAELQQAINSSSLPESQ